MDLDDFLDDNLEADEKSYEGIIGASEHKANQNLENDLEIEGSNSKYERRTYINRNLIFSDRYIIAIKSLGENRECSRLILDAARSMAEHHHGDEYEDLYFIDSVANKCEKRTDYRIRPREVMPTDAMKTFAKDNPNIISVHNHPSSSLPSFMDISTCKDIGYKYGLIICHNGSIYQYRTFDKDINKNIYICETNAYIKDETQNLMEYNHNMLDKNDYIKIHEQNFIELTHKLLDAGVILKEVLWDVDRKRTGDY